MRGVLVPPGTGTVTFAYQSFAERSWPYITALLALLTMIFVVLKKRVA
jgi:hypothetical protein